MNKKRLVACLLTASILVSSAWNVCAVGPDTAAAGQVISYSCRIQPMCTIPRPWNFHLVKHCQNNFPQK